MPSPAWEIAGGDSKAPQTSTTKENAQSNDGFSWKFKWENGLVFETSDKDFRIHIGGRVDWDSGWYSAPANVQSSLNTPLEDGTDLRRFRFRTDGTLWQQLDFALEADFSKASDFKELQSTPQTSITSPMPGLPSTIFPGSIPFAWDTRRST
jgi:phosphate-selective porin